MKLCYKWTRELYDDIFSICVCLTNFNIGHGYPLRAEDGADYEVYQKDMRARGANKEEDDSNRQRLYREKLKAKRQSHDPVPRKKQRISDDIFSEDEN